MLHQGTFLEGLPSKPGHGIGKTQGSQFLAPCKGLLSYVCDRRRYLQMLQFIAFVEVCHTKTGNSIRYVHFLQLITTEKGIFIPICTRLWNPDCFQVLTLCKHKVTKPFQILRKPDIGKILTSLARIPKAECKVIIREHKTVQCFAAVKAKASDIVDRLGYFHRCHGLTFPESFFRHLRHRVFHAVVGYCLRNDHFS